ncbi:MAG TPA: hydrogenase maturation protease [candidate division Zixibacteria bacterium]|nr:hydrogenase maturation protease [candidate division Zixibacteria bacterium]
MKPLLILCLGNDVLSDDAFGFRVGEMLRRRDADRLADIETAAVAGFALMDLLQGRRSVLIVDTVVTGKVQPGELHFYPRGYWTPSRALVSSHQISLPTALKFGEILGQRMPEIIDILAVEASDVQTLSEEMTAAVKAAVADAVLMVEQWIQDKTDEVKDTPRKPKDAIA